jgi:WhiB family redox-sensing transcriptional regulator
MLLAECRGTDPDLWFPERGEATSPAKEICASCFVREDCLDYALANGEKFGIWGGKSERERRRIRTERNRERDAMDVSVAHELVTLEPFENGDEPGGNSFPVRTCGRPGCDNPLTDRQPKYCSRSCQKAMSYQKSRKRLQGPQEAPNGVAAIATTAPTESALLAIPASMRTLLDDGAEQVTVLVGAYQLTACRA